jgi:hypothetical protein
VKSSDELDQKLATRKPGAPTALSSELEKVLMVSVRRHTELNHSLTNKKLCQMAAELEALAAQKAGRPPYWPGGMAGRAWLKGFLKRQDLKSVKPR